jgi:two-component sensor histidine kinase
LNELLSNALKHAFPDSGPGDIWIRMRQSQDELAFEVRDNRIGLPDRFSVAGSGSLGLQVVTDLAEQLGGSFAAANASEGGAVFRVRFRRGGQTNSASAGTPDSREIGSRIA